MHKKFSPKNSKAQLFNSARDWTNPTCHTYHLKIDGHNLQGPRTHKYEPFKRSNFISFMMAMLTRCSQLCPLDRCQHFSANCLHQLKLLWSPFILAQNRKNHVARSHRLTVRESQWREALCMSGDYCVKSQMSYNDKKLVLEEHKLTYTDYDLKEKRSNC